IDLDGIHRLLGLPGKLELTQHMIALVRVAGEQQDESTAVPDRADDLTLVARSDRNVARRNPALEDAAALDLVDKGERRRGVRRGMADEKVVFHRSRLARILVPARSPMTS